MLSKRFNNGVRCHRCLLFPTTCRLEFFISNGCLVENGNDNGIGNRGSGTAATEKRALAAVAETLVVGGGGNREAGGRKEAAVVVGCGGGQCGSGGGGGGGGGSAMAGVAAATMTRGWRWQATVATAQVSNDGRNRFSGRSRQ